MVRTGGFGKRKENVRIEAMLKERGGGGVFIGEETRL